MADRFRFFTPERDRLQIPTETVACRLTGRQSLWCVERLHRGWTQQLAAVDCHPEANEVSRGRNEHAGSRIAREADRPDHIRAIPRIRCVPREVRSHLRRD